MPITKKRPSKPSFKSDDLGQRFESRYVLWTCTNCTWHRVRTNTKEWEDTIICHPVYGFISNYNLYVRDIEKHDCIATRDARNRHGINPDTWSYNKYKGVYQDDK